MYTDYLMYKDTGRLGQILLTTFTHTDPSKECVRMYEKADAPRRLSHIEEVIE